MIIGILKFIAWLLVLTIAIRMSNVPFSHEDISVISMSLIIFAALVVYE